MNKYLHKKEEGFTVKIFVMQKLELRNNLNEIVKKLKSKEIVDYLANPSLDKNHLLKLVVDSKGGYDQAITDPEKEKVFDQFETSINYSLDNFSQLVLFISTAPNANRTTFLANNILSNFYSFHKSLLGIFNLIDNLLLTDREIFDSENDFNIATAQNNGNLILEIIDDGNVSLTQLKEIIEAIDKLVSTIYYLYDKVENEKFDQVPEVLMIDSGSDINFVLKLPEKAANLIAQIMKQFWDFIINNKSYRHGQKLKSVEKSLTVLEKIKVAREKEIIDPETAEVLKKGIIENTEKIILKNTLTKQIVLENREYSNRQLLLEQNKTYLLEMDNSNKSENPED